MPTEKYRLEPFPIARIFSIDAGRLGKKRHTIHGLIEVDVTEARKTLRAHKERTGEKLSFTAFITGCVARAVKLHDHVHAYLNWRRQLVIFEDVNVNVLVEVERDGRKFPMPHVLKAVNRRSLREVHDEIRAVQAHPGRTREADFMAWFLRLPWPLRLIFYRLVMGVPQWFHRFSSPVLVTAVGMFGQGGGWGLPLANFTLVVTLGGIAEKPGVVEGRIAVREFLDMTISADHDVVDGAPLARFVHELRQRIENCDGLDDLA